MVKIIKPNLGVINCMSRIKLPEHRISLALFALFFSHVATATLLHHKTKIAQRYATPVLTNIGVRGLKNIYVYLMDSNVSIVLCDREEEMSSLSDISFLVHDNN